MKVLYIGHYDEGSTSRMRGQCLENLLKPIMFKVVNIDVPITKSNQLFSSIAWRFKIGPTIKNINVYVRFIIDGDWEYDLVWVDKGVFIESNIIEELKKHSKLVVHYTPDTAFNYNQSKLFYKALPFYDYLITTKSFELEAYKTHNAKNILYCTQGYDSRLHKPYNEFNDKKYEACFIGLFEKERAQVIQLLIENNIQVVLAGVNWEKFAAKNKKNSNLIFKGSKVYGVEYAKLISNSFFSLGFLSNLFPEMHTTRTFEIPACGTCLITPENNEILNFYSHTDVLFFNNIIDIPRIINKYKTDKIKLQIITKAGLLKVNQGNYEYKKIIETLLTKMLN